MCWPELAFCFHWLYTLHVTDQNCHTAGANCTAAMRPPWCLSSAAKRCLLAGPLITKLPVRTGLRDCGLQQQTALAECSQGSRGKTLAHSLTRDGGWHWLETAIPSFFLPGWLYPDPPRPEGLATAFLMDAAQIPRPSSGHRFTHCLTWLPTWADSWQMTVCGQVMPPSHHPMPGPKPPVCLNFFASLRS